MALPIVSVNGLYFDHTSVRLQIPGVAMPLITSHLKSINFSDTLTPSESYGVSPIPLPSGLGQYKAEGSMTLSKEAFDQMISILPDGYGALVMDIVITYVPKGAFKPATTILHGSRFMAPKDTSSSGGGNLDVELGLYVRYITRNGKCLVPIDVDEVQTTLVG